MQIVCHRKSALLTVHALTDCFTQAKNLDLLVPVPIVGAALGTVASAPLMNKLGRKRAMVLAYFLGAAPGSFLSMFAPNMAAQIVGRFWTSE